MINFSYVLKKTFTYKRSIIFPNIFQVSLETNKLWYGYWKIFPETNIFNIGIMEILIKQKAYI